MDRIKPTRREDGKTFCGKCNAQIVFYWARRPEYCALCGAPIEWEPDKTAIQRLRLSVEASERENDKMTRLTTRDGRALLDLLEFMEDLDDGEEAAAECSGGGEASSV